MIYHSASSTPTTPAVGPTRSNTTSNSSSSKLTTAYVTHGELTAAIQQAIGTLPAITGGSGQSTSPSIQAQLDALQREVALTNSINNLAPTNNVALTISNPTITGGTISNAALQGNTLSAGAATLGATTIAGGLTATGGVTFDSATTTNFFTTTANSTNLFTVNATTTSTYSSLYNTSSLGKGYEIDGGTVLQASSTLYNLSIGHHLIGLAPYTLVNSNTFVGEGAFDVNNGSTDNTAVGANALNSLSGPSPTSGGSNSAFGQASLYKLTSGGNNSAFGSLGMFNATSSSNNVAVGYGALYGNAGTGGTYDDNTAIGVNSLWSETTGSYNTALGYSSLYANTTGGSNVAVGAPALQANTTGSHNIAVGIALPSNISGSQNVAIGDNALNNSTASSYNTAVGVSSLYSDTSGQYNVGQGVQSLNSNTTGSNSAAIGYQALYNNTNSDQNTAIGAGAGYGNGSYTSGLNVLIGVNANRNAANSANYNTFVGYAAGYNNQAQGNTGLGYQAGYDITTGYYNLVLGYYPTTGVGLTSGNNNILFGYDVRPVSRGGSNQLNIGNLIFGTGLGSGTTLSTGSLGIGTTSPATLLELGGSTANLTMDGYKNCTGFTSNANGLVACTASDQRLKQGITPLDASSTLSAINALTPVSFFWRPETDRGTQQQYGLIAQAVQQIFPNLVSTSSPTDLTPDGTLTVNYDGLIAPIIIAIQTLSREVASLTATVAGFAESFTTKVINSQKDNTQQLCISDGPSDSNPLCITKSQLANILSGQSSPSVQVSQSTTPVVSTSTPPTINIQGQNPATIHIGDTYTDLGAIVTDNQGHNLGYTTYLNGVLVSTLSIDTSTTTTDTIDYVATDTWGNTSTSTRTVVIETAN